jgi:hypothetical protein
MGDVMLVLLVIGFFALATAYVRACASVVGPDMPLVADPQVSSGETEVTL